MPYKTVLNKPSLFKAIKFYFYLIFKSGYSYQGIAKIIYDEYERHYENPQCHERRNPDSIISKDFHNKKDYLRRTFMCVYNIYIP